MKLIAIGGEPATGKTTLLREFLAQWPASQWQSWKKGVVMGHLNSTAKVGVFGSYSGHTFDGTDRMSMAVQPEAVKFLLAAASTPHLKDYTWIFEGDRLFTRSFLDFIKNLPGAKLILVLEASAEAKERRHRERRDNQPETFLKAKATKISNIKAQFPEAKVWPHENPEDTAQIVRWLVGHAKGEEAR